MKVTQNIILDEISENFEKTIQIARRFSTFLKPGDVVALYGQLGAGKTCFAKGVVSELTGIPAFEITSPTFTLIEEYDKPLKIYHVDLYRIESDVELENLPWEDLFSKNSISLIEWPEKMKDLIKHCQYEVKILNINERHKRHLIINKKETS